jgi:hypothetical protein
MAIRTLSLQEFDRVRSARTTMAQRLTNRAVEWFTDDKGAVLGAIAYDEHDLDWSFVMLGRDHHGKFRALDRDVGLGDLADARRLLVDKMAEAVALGKRLFPPVRKG